MDKLLKLIKNDCRLSTKDLAAICERDEADIAAAIKKYEGDKVILGYKTLIDWDKTDREYVTALIELKVTPARNQGFDKVAEEIYSFPEVQSLYLMSGGFDLAVIIEGKTMKEVAMFVAERLAPLESVIATATHFVLKKYKDKGVVFGPDEKDERGYIEV
jgi:DNA-binding Lrp family transcriptional regulator